MGIYKPTMERIRIIAGGDRVPAIRLRYLSNELGSVR